MSEDDAARAAELRRFASLAVGEAIDSAHGGGALRRKNCSAMSTACRTCCACRSSASRQEQVTDRASIATMLEETVRLCPPDRVQRIRIEVEPALRALAARARAGDAAEAGLPEPDHQCRRGASRGRIRRDPAWTAPAIEDSRGTWLELTFTDNGLGIASEALGRVFEKGFSTKSAKRNSGIGLHWCANAMASIGGSIGVDEQGPRPRRDLHPAHAPRYSEGAGRMSALAQETRPTEAPAHPRAGRR